MTHKDQLFAAAREGITHTQLNDGARIDGITEVGRHSCTVRVVERGSVRYFKLALSEMQ